MKSWGLLLSLTGLMACTEAPIKEYFCETSPREGESQFYQQQIFQVQNDGFCVLGSSNQPVCAVANQSTSTPWRLQDADTQVREITKLKISKDTLSMDVEQESRTTQAAPAENQSNVVSVHYEFQKRTGTLTQSTQEASPITVYACKPWTKRAWWQIY